MAAADEWRHQQDSEICQYSGADGALPYIGGTFAHSDSGADTHAQMRIVRAAETQRLSTVDLYAMRAGVILAHGGRK